MEEIDFPVIENCTEVKTLLTYYDLLKADGGYFTELMQACIARVKLIDPKTANRHFPEKLSWQDIEASKQLLLQWEAELKQEPSHDCVAGKQLVRNTTAKIESFYFEDLRKAREAVASKDYQEAELFYSKAIAQSNALIQDLTGRAEVRIFLSKYRECMEDCQKILSLDQNNWKALHLRGKARLELGFFQDAIRDFDKATSLAPPSHQKDIEFSRLFAEAREKKESQKETFKKVQIIEVSDDEEEQTEIITKKVKVEMIEELD